MKKNLMFALGLVALFALAGCSGNSPEEDSTQLWPAGDDNGKYGYIDKSGQMIIEPRYEAAARFSSGYALVKTTSGNGLFITKNGVEKQSDAFTEVKGSAFYYNYATVRSSGKCGLLNTKLKYAVSPAYADMGNMTADGLVAATSNGDKWGYINRSGEQIIPEKYVAAYDFVDGLAIVVNEKGKFGCIDLAGNERIVANYDYLQAIGNGCIVFLSDNKYGLLDVNGTIKVPAEYDIIASAQRWREGWLPACKNGQWGYIDQNGKVKIDFRFDDASMFSEGLAFVSTDGRFQCIDTKGAIKFILKEGERPRSITSVANMAMFFRGYHNGLIGTEVYGLAGSTCNYRDQTGAIIYSWTRPVPGLLEDVLQEVSLSPEKILSEPHNLFDPEAVAF